MTAGTSEHQDADITSLNVPFHIERLCGRTELRMLDGEPKPHRTDSTIVKALARAFWTCPAFVDSV